MKFQLTKMTCFQKQEILKYVFSSRYSNISSSSKNFNSLNVSRYSMQITLFLQDGFVNCRKLNTLLL